MKMKSLWMLPVLAVLMTACTQVTPTTPVQIPTEAYPEPEVTEAYPEPVIIPTTPEVVMAYPEVENATPEPTLAAPESSLYRDDQAGYELDYPVGWMLEASTVVGSRGSQATLASWQHQPGDVQTDRPEGSTLVTMMVYQWDPKQDLAAYVAQRKLAWEASGFVILSEESVVLSGEQSAQVFVVETPEKMQSFSLFTTVGEAYLQISGDGDLELVREIALTTRVISQ